MQKNNKINLRPFPTETGLARTKAFTLVELIVVITILAILGTIAFINLQGYSTSARDGKRVSDINNIMKKIGIESSKGTSLSNLIITTKTNSGLTINGNSGSSIQGTANFATLKEDGSKFKDPVTKGDYVFSYSVGGSGTGAYKFTQASTVNEELNQAVVKGNYYKMQTGDSPSITYNPDNTYFVVDGGVDLPYEIVAGTTPTTPVITWLDLDPNCDIPDITIGTQTWAGCNSTLGTGIEYSVDQNCYNYQGGPATTGCNRPSNEKENVYNPTYGVNNIWGKLYTWSGTTMGETDLSGNLIQADNDTICPAGRHVPSDTEWTILTNYIVAQNGGSVNIGWSAQSGKDEINNLVKALKIPLAGYYDSGGTTFYGRGRIAYLWSSTPSSNNAYYWDLYWSNSTVNRYGYSSAIDFSVRCIKD